MARFECCYFRFDRTALVSGPHFLQADGETEFAARQEFGAAITRPQDVRIEAVYEVEGDPDAMED